MRFSHSVFHGCLSQVLSRICLGKDSTEHQLKAIETFLFGGDMFAWLPTRHGKSLIYRLTVPLAKELSASCEFPRLLPSGLILIIVAPSKALISDQIKSLHLRGESKEVLLTE